MLLNLSMRLEKILILSSILLIFIVACSSIDNINTADSCIIFEEKRSWYKSTKNSYTTVSYTHLTLPTTPYV